MSQDPYNKTDNKLPRFNNKPNSGGENPKKGPKFSIYWVYAIIFAVLIGFNFFGPLSSNIAKTNPNAFKEMLAEGDVEKFIIVSNKNMVRVYLKKDKIAKYSDNTERGVTGKINQEGPHLYFKITGEGFKEEINEFYAANPNIKEVLYEVEQERDWFSGILNLLLPVLLFIALWILLMRKMGGGAGSGGGPGGIFNIGKSKATLFDKGTKVNITFKDV